MFRDNVYLKCLSWRQLDFLLVLEEPPTQALNITMTGGCWGGGGAEEQAAILAEGSSAIDRQREICLRHLPPSVENTFCFWSHRISASLPVSFSPLSLSLPVWCDWSAFCHSGAIKSLLGVETPAARCLILENTAIRTLTLSHPCRHSQHQCWLWICNIPSCVKDLQHFLQHAWKGKTGG